MKVMLKELLAHILKHETSNASFELLADLQRYVAVNDVYNLSHSWKNYKYLTIGYGSVNNCGIADIPTISFKDICDNRPYGFILWNWNNQWADLMYTSDTQIKCIRISAADTMFIHKIWGHN